MSDFKDGLNIYKYSNIDNRAYKITQETKKEVYHDTDFFGLTLVLDEENDPFFSIDNVIKKYEIAQRNISI